MNDAVEILHVEDNPGDVELLQRSFGKLKIANRVHAVSNGEEALAFLRREGGYEGAPRPDLILLDLNMPRMDGREFLNELRKSPEFGDIPVIVMTSSEAETDVVKAYRLGANAYVSKPIHLSELAKIVGAIEGFWFSIVRLPSRSAARTPTSSRS
jgi:chemotaxis family two-component system response regulator Rcp1